jgi:uncharacterized 2Fe-2S/4Fe-4S cluster protein (DUF4445 family)
MSTQQTVIDFEPVGRRATAQPGETILQVAQRAGVGIMAVCGGHGTCGRCVVQVRAGQLSEPTAVEKKRFSPDQLAQGFRLACQAKPLSDIKLYIPPSSMTTTQRTQVEGKEYEVEFEPAVRVVRLNIPPATLEDLRSDAQRLRDVCRAQCPDLDGRIDFTLLRQLSHVVRQLHWDVKVVLRQTADGHEVIAVLPPAQIPLGLAVDLGTTKVAGYLVNMETGETLQAKGIMNPQISYGEDVMARITYAMEGPEKAETLRLTIVHGIEDLAKDMCKEIGAGIDQIVEAVIVGNTAMHHLFLGLPVHQLGTAPYVPAENMALDVKARDLGFHFAPGAYVHLLPNIAGFVGADHVAMLLATGIGEAPEDEVWVGMDIGTNTEIGMSARGRLLTCSTASGPAFEGAHIKYGMRAAPGAIEAVRLEEDGELRVRTIDNQPAVGICGSGILDVIAELFKRGILNRRGAMSEAPRVRPSNDGRGYEYVLVPAEESGIHEDITVSRGDISEIQLAKGAMRAGLDLLLQTAGLTEQDITRFVIAGAFGTYIDLESAITIGMLPAIPRQRFVQVGNAAGIGAKQALLSVKRRQKAVAIAQKAEYIELTTDPRFTGEFSRTIQLGQPDAR